MFSNKKVDVKGWFEDNLVRAFEWNLEHPDTIAPDASNIFDDYVDIIALGIGDLSCIIGIHCHW
jgi:hypothetical protein